MTINLDTLTNPYMETEVFQPENAWADDVEHAFVSVARGAAGLIWQIGGVPGEEAYFIRFRRGDAPWGAWGPFETPDAAAQPDVAPTLDELEPSTAELGGADFTLHLLGAGFTPASVIYFANQPEPIVFVSAEEITTVVKPSLGWGAVTVPVLVKNGAESSASLDFTFTEP